ncbi:MAG: haloalkane dehalogenase, partial [Dehalococcoidia bacterium]
KSDLQKLLLYAQPGALMRGPLLEWCRENMRNLKTLDIGAGSHFVQEDQPQAIGEAIAEWYKAL